MKKLRHLAILLTALAASVLTTGCVIHLNMPLARPSRGERLVLETLVKPDRFFTPDKVLLIGLDGVLTDAPDEPGSLSRPSVLVGLKDVLKRAEKDDSIRAVLLRINTPGGGVTASDLIYEELRRFKEKTGKRIVAVMMDLAASGGYYAAMASDRIVAHPTSVTGSIGVVAVFPGLKGLTSKIGVDMRIVKTGEFKDLGSMWRDFSPADREIIQKTIDTMYTRFVDVVATGRPNLSRVRILELADGRIYTAQQALDAGLIDQIGYIEDAFEAAKEMAGLSDAALVSYTPPYVYQGHYYAAAEAGGEALGGSGSAPSQINLFNIDVARIFSQPGGGPFYYLWLP
ncbi:signal peptide peptidase SppA [Candidatus Sumerlaeota bacterium]|nr:signal peptide peptidase SppA [Candidatus Sumerlaeota bacterium]